MLSSSFLCLDVAVGVWVGGVDEEEKDGGKGNVSSLSALAPLRPRVLLSSPAQLHTHAATDTYAREGSAPAPQRVGNVSFSSSWVRPLLFLP